MVPSGEDATRRTGASGDLKIRGISAVTGSWTGIAMAIEIPWASVDAPAASGAGEVFRNGPTA
jgi:hypothetical protein